MGKKLFLDKIDAILEGGGKYVVLLLFSFFFVLLFSETSSILYRQWGTDSYMFKMMGFVIANGGVPYVDYMDHKGLIVHLINALGIILSPDWGLFSLQIVSLFFVLLLWYKISRLFVRAYQSFVVLLFALFLFSGLYQEGDLTEEWSLLPTSLAIYLALSYLTKMRDSAHPLGLSFVYGLCFGIVFFIRPNDAVMQCGGVMTGIFLYIIFAQKNYKSAFLNALSFLGGGVIIALPIVGYLASRQALDEFWLAYFEFNFNYNGGILYNVFVRYRVTMGIMALCSIPIVLSYARDKKELLWILCPISVLALLFYGRGDYPHYHMIMMPAFFVMSFTLLFLQRNKYIVIITVILFIFLPNKFKRSDSWGTYTYTVLAHDVIKEKVKRIVRGELVQRENVEFEETEKLFSCVPEEEKDSIWNYNDLCSMFFYHNGIVSQNPVPPLMARSNIFPADKAKMLDMSNYRPRWVFINPCCVYFLPTDSAYLSDNYELYYQTDVTKCNYQLLRRKDR